MNEYHEDERTELKRELINDIKCEIVALLKESNKKYNQTIIVITHDPDIASVANRVITIEDGKIVSDVRN